jgi:hypothetical protein
MSMWPCLQVLLPAELIMKESDIMGVLVEAEAKKKAA